MNYIITKPYEDNLDIFINIDHIVSINPIGPDIEPVTKIITTRDIIYTNESFDSIIQAIDQAKEI